MSARPIPAQSEFYAGLLPLEPSVEPPAVRPADPKNDQFPNRWPSFGKRASRAIARFLIALGIGVAATLAWQSYGDAAREMIAGSYPQLVWLAPKAAPIPYAAQAAPSPDQQQLDAMSLDLDAVRQSIDWIATSIAAIQEQMTRSADRIAASHEQITRSVDQIAPSIVANQEQIARSVDQLAAGQEQMTREITKLQAVEQYVLYKNSDPPPRPAAAQVPKPVLRPSQTPTVR